MTCAALRALLTAHAEGLLDGAQELEVARHLAGCRACQAAAAEHQRLRDALEARGRAYASADLGQSVVATIAARRASGTLLSRSYSMNRRYGLGVGLAIAAAVLFAFIVPWGGPRHSEANAAQVFERAIAAAAQLQSVYLRLNMRTIPGDNFEVIQLDHPLVPVELWKEFKPTPRWRAENGGRTVVMDGQSGVALIGDQLAYKFDATPTFGTWVGQLMDVEDVLDAELRQARAHGWPLVLTEEKGPKGRSVLVVTIEAKAQGDFTHDWCKNQAIVESDNRRIYRFDAQTERLEDLELWVHAPQGDVLVLETERVSFNETLPAAVFKLKVPPGVAWHVPPNELPRDEALAAMKPDEVARYFFQALSDGNGKVAAELMSMSEFPEDMRQALVGLEIVEIGTPFQSGMYPGWFVPYTIRIQDHVRQHKLAVRNDNPAGRWLVDGGF